jgi:hypothetical protein
MTDFYESNNLTNMLETLPGYEGFTYGEDYSYNFYEKSYVKWRIRCEDDGLTREVMLEMVEDVSTAWKWQAWFQTVNLWNMVLVGLCFGVINWVLSFHTFCTYRNLNTSNPCKKFFGPLSSYTSLFFSFVKLCFIFLTVSLIDSAWWKIDLMKGINCSDPTTNSTF